MFDSVLINWFKLFNLRRSLDLRARLVTGLHVEYAIKLPEAYFC